MRWRNARRKKRTRTGYQDISPHAPSEEEKQKANARLQKASALSVKAATTTFNAITEAGADFLDKFFSTPDPKTGKMKKVQRKW